LETQPVWIWLANVLVPGTGLVLSNRVLFGAAWALAWAVATAGWLASAVFQGGDVGRAGFSVARVASPVLWAGGQVLLGLWRHRRARAAAGEDADRLFAEAQTAYLRGELDRAEALCRTLRRRNPDDVEAVLQLASVAMRRGDGRSARRLFAQARFLDDVGKWDFEIERGLRAAQQVSSSPAPGRSVPSKASPQATEAS
jgi:hypothetical protein